MVNNEGISTTNATYRVALEEVYRLGYFAEYFVCCIQRVLIYFFDSYFEYSV